MNNANFIWVRVQAALTAVAGVLGYFVGGWDGMLVTLVVFMAVDYVTGVACAVIEKKLASDAGFRGLFKKMLILMLVGVANMLDVNVIGDGAMLRTAVIAFYLSNEGISLLENAARIGLPIPQKLKDILAQLHGKGGGGNPDDGGEDPQSEGK